MMTSATHSTQPLSINIHLYFASQTARITDGHTEIGCRVKMLYSFQRFLLLELSTYLFCDGDVAPFPREWWRVLPPFEISIWGHFHRYNVVVL